LLRSLLANPEFPKSEAVREEKISDLIEIPHEGEESHFNVFLERVAAHSQGVETQRLKG